MSARGLLAELEGRGITPRPSPGGNLRCKPQSALSPEDVSRIKEHKAELLNVVGGEKLASPSVPQEDKADIYGDSGGTQGGDASGDATLPRFVQEEEERRAKRASDLGLIARWSREFGYIAIHDPTSGEWHDVATKDAPAWAKNECAMRRKLRKQRGVTRLLNQQEMEEIWREETPAMWDKPAGVTRHGIVYEDYVEEED